MQLYLIEYNWVIKVNNELKERKAKRKSEAENREVVKKELEKENEISEQTIKEFQEERKQEELSEYKNTSKKFSISKIIFRIVWTILLLFILFEVVIGFLDMNRLNNNQEPLWYFNSRIEKVNNKTETTYNLGLYVIVKTFDGNSTRVVLKPFFLK